MINAQKIIDIYGLEPLPGEGGYYKETHRSKDTIPADKLPDRYQGHRSYSTSIYYLLTSDTKSLIHRLKSDEIFHFYYGDTVEMLQLYADGKGKIYTLGKNITEGDYLQLIVPNGTWQGMQLKNSGEYALMGTTVSPGFELQDFELGKREFLITEYPDYKEKIIELTR